MKILITGDFVLNNQYSKLNIDNSVLSFFEQSDLNIVNLEAPVTDNKSKIDKTGPNIKSHKDSTEEVLKALNVDVVTLANNHILDYDEQGVEDTLSFCKDNNIKTVGAGMNLKEASLTFYKETNEGKLAIVNFAENEWTSATENTAGSNPMDLIDNTKQIIEAKNNADFVLVIIHGGNEYNHYPSPRMVKQYRYYAECGADAVIAHHTHCISGYEEHKGVPIFYSLGNFLFTMDNYREQWYTGLIISIVIKRNRSIEFELIPIEQSKETFNLYFPDEIDRLSIHNKIQEINEVISNPILLEKKWHEFINEVESGFIKTISPIAAFNNRYLKGFLYKSGLYRYFLNQKYLKESLNRIRCEAHNDVVHEILKKYIKN